VVATLRFLPLPTTVSAPDTLSLMGAVPALVVLALACGVGVLVVRRVTSRLRQTFQTRALLMQARARCVSDAQLQGVQGLLFHLQAVHDLLPDRPDEARRALERAMDAGDGMVERLLEGARIAEPPSTPVDLANGLGLVACELAACCSSRQQLRVLARGRPRVVLRSAHEGLLQAARAALSNAIQHSCGRHIELELAYLRRGLTLRVRDDGTGIGKEAARGQPGGLAAICDISSAIGARVEVWSRVRAGTEVTITLPWPRASAGGSANIRP
jgi:signal transduction histidine kinase